MSKPSNPFLTDGSILDYTPDLRDIEQELVDAAVVEEVKSGRLPADALRPEVLTRIGRS